MQLYCVYICVYAIIYKKHQMIILSRTDYLFVLLNFKLYEKYNISYLTQKMKIIITVIFTIIN